MKLIQLLIMPVFFATMLHAEEIVINSDGDQVILNDDFTWELVDAANSVSEDSQYITLELLDTSEYGGRGCRLTFNVTSHGIKIFRLSIRNYFRFYDDDGDQIPLRGLGDRILLVQDTFDDGDVVNTTTLPDYVSCEEISRIEIGPVIREDARVLCTTREGENNSCEFIIRSSIGQSWDLRGGRVISFEDSLTRSDLRRVQELLNEAGFEAGSPDGIFGRSSIIALRRFQQSIGFPDTGELSEELLRELGFYDE